MPINDYKCTNKSCAFIEHDMIERPDACLNCGSEMEVTFENWNKLEFNPYSSNDRVDSKGFVRRFSASDDPLCLAQLGIGDSQLQEYNKMTPEESAEFRGKMIAEGDSPKLRRQILAKYNEKVGNKYELQD
jgi:hypothetical protein